MGGLVSSGTGTAEAHGRFPIADTHSAIAGLPFDGIKNLNSGCPPDSRMSNLLSEVRYSVRALRKMPGFSLIALLVLSANSDFAWRRVLLPHN